MKIDGEPEYLRSPGNRTEAKSIEYNDSQLDIEMLKADSSPANGTAAKNIKYNDSQLDIEMLKADSSPSNGTAVKSIEYNDSQLDIEMLKADNGIRREGKHDFTLLAECKGCKKVVDPSQLEEGPGSHGATEVGNSVNDSQKEGGHMIAPLSVSVPQSEMHKKETDFYTDKAVTEVELPQMIVCFKEGSYHVIKDICVDEGLHSFENGLIENEVDHKRVDNFSYSTTDESRYLANEKPVLGMLKSSGLNEQPIIDVDQEVAREPSSKSLEGAGKFDGIYEAIVKLSEEEIISTKLLPLQYFDRGHCQTDASNSDCNSGIPQSSGDNGDQSVHDNSNQEQSDEVAREGANPITSVVCSSVEVLDKSSDTICEDFPSNSKEESGSITFDFDSGPPAMSARIDSKGKTEFQQSVQVINRSGPEEADADGLTASARSSFVHHGYADSSFAGPASLSASIAYSGQIPYSGSISLRSDSSTTSTRSFAFPVLQSEWNSSPVKMAKADRRLYKKHRGWRLGLFCCRF